LEEIIRGCCKQLVQLRDKHGIVRNRISTEHPLLRFFEELAGTGTVQWKVLILLSEKIYDDPAMYVNNHATFPHERSCAWLCTLHSKPNRNLHNVHAGARCEDRPEWQSENVMQFVKEGANGYLKKCKKREDCKLKWRNWGFECRQKKLMKERIH
jgi:hypothetical protein